MKDISVYRLLTRDQMEKLNTRRLLSYKNALLTAVESNEGEESPILGIKGRTFAKNTFEWQETYKIAKEILANREHVKR